MKTIRRNILTHGSNIKGWDPSKGDYIPESSTEEVKKIKNRIRKQIALIFILSFTTISIFLAAVFYFSILQH